MKQSTFVKLIAAVCKQQIKRLIGDEAIGGFLQDSTDILGDDLTGKLVVGQT